MFVAGITYMYFRLLLERHFGFKLISQSSQHNCLGSATEPDLQSGFAFLCHQCFEGQEQS
jgi:hypothetical protein